jgi:threonine/homoserine/homoserine lactone efflux protein
MGRIPENPSSGKKLQQMIEGLFSGILLGLTMAIMLGPALFSLLQTSIHRGFKAGMFMAMGIFASDCLLVALSYLGVSSIITEPENTVLFGIIGGCVMIVFGLFTFKKKTNIKTDDDDDIDTPVPLEKVKPLKYMAKGFALNILNPFLLIFWMGWMAYVGNTYGPRSPEIAIFFGGTLTTVLSTDLLKCFIAGKIKQYLKPRVITIVNYILGATLIILGIYMILRVTYLKADNIGKDVQKTEMTIELNH